MAHPSTPATVNEVLKALNLSFLCALREIALKSPEEAAVRFGMSLDRVTSISHKTPTELFDRANSAVAMFRPHEGMMNRLTRDAPDSLVQIQHYLRMVEKGVAS